MSLCREDKRNQETTCIPCSTGSVPPSVPAVGLSTMQEESDDDEDVPMPYPAPPCTEKYWYEEKQRKRKTDPPADCGCIVM